MITSERIPLSVTVLGSGTSTGVPVISCDCEVCVSPDPKNKRTRASILITRLDTNQSVVIDTAPEFRQHMLDHGVKKLSNVVYTHTHADHTHGFDDLRAFYFWTKVAVNCFIGKEHIEELRTRFSYAFFDTGYVGTPPQVELIQIDDKPFQCIGLEFEPVRLPHGSVTTLAFRIGNFAYATDFKFFPKEVLQKWQGKIDTMIASGLHFRAHPTHSTIPETLKLFDDLAVKTGVITHLSHNVDYGRDSKGLPANRVLAYDGFNIKVG